MLALQVEQGWLLPKFRREVSFSNPPNKLKVPVRGHLAGTLSLGLPDKIAGSYFLSIGRSSICQKGVTFSEWAGRRTPNVDNPSLVIHIRAVSR